MKTLYAARHAKSSWGHANLTDHDRPLNERGERTGPEMAERLRARGIGLDRLVCSSARRARETAQFFVDALGLPSGCMRVEPALYGAGVDDWVRLIRALDDSWTRVMMVGHNPTLTELANGWGRMDIANVPTSGVIACSYTGTGWSTFGEDPGELALGFDFPKNPSADWV